MVRIRCRKEIHTRLKLLGIAMTQPIHDKKKLLGITMRVSEETAYHEIRDAIDQKWMAFLKEAAPGYFPVLIPSDEMIAQQIGLEIDGLLLTGGNDLGTYPKRDQIERHLLKQSLERNIPIIGICRGMQLIADWFGAKLVSGNKSLHCGTRHRVVGKTGVLDDILAGSYEVNSFHRWCIDMHDTSNILSAVETNDHSIEALVVRNKNNVVGVMWHPERERHTVERDIRLFRKIFVDDSK